MSEFLTKDEFHTYVMDNRDRQDANKTEIIDTLQTVIRECKEDLENEVDDVGGRVTKLEDENTKQNRITGAITAINVTLLGILAYLK